MYLRVHVKAGSKKELVTKKGADEFLIAVKEPAERNLANRRVCELIAEQFALSPKAVRIISGHHSPTKILDLKN